MSVRNRRYAAPVGVAGLGAVNYLLRNPEVAEDAAHQIAELGRGIKRGWNRNNAFSEEKKVPFSKRRKPVKRSSKIYARPQSRRFKDKCTLNKICKFMKHVTSVHKHYERSAAHYSCGSKNVEYYESYVGGTILGIENAMANLRYFDPTTNDVIVKNPAVGTYNRDINVSIYRKLTFRNNYISPVHVQIYSCTPKESTAITPATARANGLAKQGAPPTDSVLLLPKFSEELRNLWVVKPCYDKILKAGENGWCDNYTKAFDYDISTNDVQTAAFQKRQGGHSWLIRISGVICHDSVQVNELGLGEGAIDCMIDVCFTFKYDSGKDLEDYSVNDISSLFTNTGRFSLKPAALQESYTRP